jgi:hypothetical protein
MGIGPDHDRDVARAHESEHRGAGIHLGEGFVEAAGVEFHRDAGGGDAVEGALDVGLDAGKIPVGGGLVFHEIGVGHSIEEPGLGRLGDVVKISALVGKGVAGEKAGFVGNHLHVDGTEHMMERHAGVQITEPSFQAETRQVIALQAEANIDAAGEFLAGAGNEIDVSGKLFGAHPVLKTEAVGERAMTGEDDAL